MTNLLATYTLQNGEVDHLS